MYLPRRTVLLSGKTCQCVFPITLDQFKRQFGDQVFDLALWNDLLNGMADLPGEMARSTKTLELYYQMKNLGQQVLAHITIAERKLLLEPLAEGYLNFKDFNFYLNMLLLDPSFAVVHQLVIQMRDTVLWKLMGPFGNEEHVELELSQDEEIGMD